MPYFDSNGDLHDDDEQVYTVFRTNATGGAYGAAGVWVALPPTMTNVTSGAPDMSAAAALYVFDAEVESGKGEPFMVVYKGVPYPVNAAQGRELRRFENGSNDEVYIGLENGHFAKFTKSSSAPSDYSASTYPVAGFLANRQETYFGEKAVDLSSDEDDDFDGAPNIRETGRGMNPYSNDSDGDYVLDGVEQRWSSNTDNDRLINALDKDSDNDGVRAAERTTRAGDDMHTSAPCTARSKPRASGHPARGAPCRKMFSSVSMCTRTRSSRSPRPRTGAWSTAPDCPRTTRSSRRTSKDSPAGSTSCSRPAVSGNMSTTLRRP